MKCINRTFRSILLILEKKIQNIICFNSSKKTLKPTHLSKQFNFRILNRINDFKDVKISNLNSLCGCRNICKPFRTYPWRIYVWFNKQVTFFLYEVFIDTLLTFLLINYSICSTHVCYVPKTLRVGQPLNFACNLLQTENPVSFRFKFMVHTSDDSLGTTEDPFYEEEKVLGPGMV